MLFFSKKQYSPSNMKNFLPQIAHDFPKILMGLGLLHGFSSQVLGTKKDQEQWIKRALYAFQGKNDLVKKVFSQPLELMGIDNSPLDKELQEWSYTRGKTFSHHKKLFEALLLKAIIGLLGDQNPEDLQDRELFLNFSSDLRKTLPVDIDHTNDSNDYRASIMKHNKSYKINIFCRIDCFFNNALEVQETMATEEEKMKYFMQNFNFYAKHRNISIDKLSQNFYNFLKQYKDFIYRQHEIFFIKEEEIKKNLDEILFGKIVKTLMGQHQKIEQYFSSNFFIKKLFSSLTKAEYICLSSIFLTYLDCKDSLFNSTIFSDVFSTFFQKDIRKLSKNSFLDMSTPYEEENTLKITKGDLEDILDTLFVPLKSFFLFNYYSLFGLRSFLELDNKYDIFEIFIEQPTDEINSRLEKDLTEKLKIKTSFLKEKAINKIETFFTKDTLKNFSDNIHEMFFISFMEQPFVSLRKFHRKAYNNFIEEIKKKTSFAREAHYGGENFLQFLKFLNSFEIHEKFLYTKQIKIRDEIIVGHVLPYIVGTKDAECIASIIYKKKDNESFMKPLERALSCLFVSSDPEVKVLNIIIKKRMEILKEKINLLEEINFLHKEKQNLQKEKNPENQEEILEKIEHLNHRIASLEEELNGPTA